jgi:hypothetical protein
MTHTSYRGQELLSSHQPLAHAWASWALGGLASIVSRPWSVVISWRLSPLSILSRRWQHKPPALPQARLCCQAWQRCWPKN